MLYLGQGAGAALAADLERAVAALKTFYRCAREDGHVTEVPFRRKTLWVLPYVGSVVLTAAFPGGRPKWTTE